MVRLEPCLSLAVSAVPRLVTEQVGQGLPSRLWPVLAVLPLVQVLPLVVPGVRSVQPLGLVVLLPERPLVAWAVLLLLSLVPVVPKREPGLPLAGLLVPWRSRAVSAVRLLPVQPMPGVPVEQSRSLRATVVQHLPELATVVRLVTLFCSRALVARLLVERLA